MHDPSSTVSEMNVWWGQAQYVTFDPSQTLEQHIILLVDCDEHACVWECESVSWCLCLALTLVTCAFFPFCGRESAVYPAETHIQLEYGWDSFQTDSIQVVNHTAKNSWSNKGCCELLLWISANLVANLLSHEHNVLISEIWVFSCGHIVLEEGISCIGNFCFFYYFPMLGHIVLLFGF